MVILDGLTIFGQTLNSPSLNLTVTALASWRGRCGSDSFSSVWSQAGPRRAVVRAANAARPQTTPHRVILEPLVPPEQHILPTLSYTNSHTYKHYWLGWFLCEHRVQSFWEKNHGACRSRSPWNGFQFCTTRWLAFFHFLEFLNYVRQLFGLLFVLHWWLNSNSEATVAIFVSRFFFMRVGGFHGTGDFHSKNLFRENASDLFRHYRISQRLKCTMSFAFFSLYRWFFTLNTTPTLISSFSSLIHSQHSLCVFCSRRLT